MLHFFLNGGPSHLDTFDPKPALAKYAGKPLPTGHLPTERKTGGAFPSPFRFSRHGQSGLEIDTRAGQVYRLTFVGEIITDRVDGPVMIAGAEASDGVVLLEAEPERIDD